ncbi:MAG: RNA polymerase sigma-70 factor [Tannerella sp.]|jgi:RNA polymerase sigma-70 factor (ECF subfamily)|nr:RNA polymerase sigma-70 factor [Tannerella sp.]
MNESNEIDAQLMAGIKEGDYVSYNKLFASYYHPLCQFVYSLTENREDAEDIVQELFLHVWQDRKKITITDSVSGYLYKMAKNMTLNHIRKETNYKKLLEKQEIPLSEENNSMETAEFKAALSNCMKLLSARNREILLLDRIKGLRQQEIADKLSISVKTVKNQIWLSLQKLKTCLEHKDVL